LLKVGRKSMQVLIVRQNRMGFALEKIIIPDSKQPHDNWNIFCFGIFFKPFDHFLAGHFFHIQIKNNQIKNLRIQKNSIQLSHQSLQNRSNASNPSNQSTTQKYLEDKLPESIIRKIDYCNSVINMMDYERARSVYNDTMSSFADLDDEDVLKKISHVKTKLEAYMHIHNARRHLYFKRLEHFTVTIKSLNNCYGTIAHNIGFMQHIDTGSEVKFLNFVAENVKQLEKNRDLMLKNNLGLKK